MQIPPPRYGMTTKTWARSYVHWRSCSKRRFLSGMTTTRGAARKCRASALEFVGAAGLLWAAQAVVKVVHFVGEEMQLARQPLDLGFGAAVHLEIQLGADAVLRVLSVLTHHDDRCLDGCQHGKKQVEQDKRIRVPSLSAGGQ